MLLARIASIVNKKAGFAPAFYYCYSLMFAYFAKRMLA